MNSNEAQLLHLLKTQKTLGRVPTLRAMANLSLFGLEQSRYLGVLHVS